MKYQRTGDIFTFESIIRQLIEYIKHDGTGLPLKVHLPPEEYMYIDYIMPNNDFAKKVTSIFGIPIEIDFNEQDISFKGL